MNKGRWTLGILIPLVFGGLVLAFLQFRHADSDDPGGESAPWFVDVSDEVGLDFVHDAGPLPSGIAYFMPQQVGSGAAFFDFDNDGLVDIFLLQNGGPKSASTNRLYRQLPNGKLQDVSKGSGLDFNGYNMGVAVGDVNNDGYLDVVVTQYSGAKLFINQGNGTFRDATKEAGLDLPSWGASAAFLDFDRDGWLDLVIVCYLDYDPTWPCKGPSGTYDYCAPRTFPGRVSRLFRNLGRIPTNKNQGVRFEDITQKSGFGTIAGPGLGVLCADFDGDGWPDIFIANDGAPNRMWMNRHDNTFVEEGVKRGVAYNMYGKAQAGMGIAYGDVDGDGLPDLFSCHLAQESHTLWKQSPRGLFVDKTSQSGIMKSHWRGTGFGTLLADFTNAGRLDLAIVNGSVAAQFQPGDPDLGPFWRKYGQRNQLFAGDGQGNFHDVSLRNPPFCGKDNIARGLAKADFDRDGGIDLLVTTIGGKARLFRNVAKERGHWLSVRAYDPVLKRDALGTNIELHAGDRTWVSWLHPSESYLCSNEPRAHFGLGAIESVDRIEVTWPNGERESFPGGPVDKRIELRKGDGKRVKQ